jgi:hypothetical protein
MKDFRNKNKNKNFVKRQTKLKAEDSVIRKVINKMIWRDLV